MNLKAYLPGALGNIVEWYDFAIYGFTAPVFAKLFFVDKNYAVNLIIVYGIFAASYLARPFGSFIYGPIGDRYGRKLALVISVASMCVFVLLMGFLPTHQSVGFYAPLFLVLLRILQGLAAGGETAGSFIYVLESVSPKRQGLYGSATQSAIIAGILIASGVTAIVSGSLSHAAYYSWGWRLLYFIGFIIGIIILLLRSFAKETEAFQKMKEDNTQSKTPIKDLFKYHKKNLLMTIGVVAAPSAGFYFTFIFLPNFINQHLGKALPRTLEINSIIQIVLIVMLISFGYLSDFFGRKKFMVIASIGMILLTYFIMWLLVGASWGNIIAGQLLFALLIACYQGPMSAFIVNNTPISIRYTAISLAYNTGFALFGGFALMGAELFTYWFKLPAAASFYWVFAGVVSLITLLSLKYLKTV